MSIHHGIGRSVLPILQTLSPQYLAYIDLLPSDSFAATNMHLVQGLLLTVTMFLAITIAVPLSRVSVPLKRSILNGLQKRTNPIIGQGIDTNDAARGGKLIPRPNFPTSGAFSNVQQMLSYALFTPLGMCLAL